MDRYSKYLAIAAALRGQPAELELLSVLHLDNGTTQEVSNVRRAVCKRVARKRTSTVLEYVDVDRSVLDQVFPFETFTVADFPDLFVDHVGRSVTQGVGLVKKVPATWIGRGNAFVFAGPKVLAAGAGTCLAVYRGTQDGQGSVVSSSEYSVGTLAAPSGFTVNTITFAREQTDFSGKPYVIEADWSLPGTATPSAEVSRILQAYGFTVDSATFTAASAADISAGFSVDALYIGRAGNAIIEDLLQVARGWLSQTSTGAYAIVQDVAKSSTLQLDTAVDLIDVSDYGDPGDLVKTVSIEYGPKRSGAEEYSFKISRTVGAGTGEKQMKSPYIQSHTVADKLLCYWQKRLPKPVASADIFAQHLANGSLVNITDATYWRGAKDFIITGISRPADLNRVKLREYDAAVYTYDVPVRPLPFGATNGYSPDYSFTPPAAPTGLTIASQSTSADTDGKVTAFATVQAVPPAVNWSQLWAQLTDTTTGEQYTQQLFLVGATYQAVFSGLRPNRLHSIIVWARNANNVDGSPATIANFTSANNTNALAAPTVVVTQKQSFEVNIDLGAVADVAGQPKFRRYVLFESVNGGSFTEVQRTPDRTLKRTVTHGLPYQYKARSEDINQNESADSSPSSITPGAVVNDNYIQGGGVSGVSIANGSINQGREKVSTASQSGTVAGGGGAIAFGGGAASDYSYAPGVGLGSGGNAFGHLGITLTPSSTQFNWLIINPDPSSQSYDAQWRQVTT